MAGYNSPFGSNSTSSLLKSAFSIQDDINSYNDAVAAYNYRNSGYTDEAFSQYADYLQGRIKPLMRGDISSQHKALTLQGTLRSALHSNISAAITRENIQIMAGNATLQDKQNLVIGQYERAVANGDYTLAQQLESQAYSISQQIQYEAQQTAAATGRANREYTNSVKDTVSQVGDYISSVVDAYKTSNTKDFQSFINSYADNLKKSGINVSSSDFMGVVSALANEQVNIYKQALANAPDATTHASLAKDYNRFIKGTVASLPTAGGGSKSLSLEDLATNTELAQYGEYPLRASVTNQFNPRTGQVEPVNTFSDVPQTGYTYGYDQQGNPVLLPTFGNQNENLSSYGTQYDENGKLVTGRDYVSLLKQAGFDVNGNFIQPTTATAGFNNGEPVQVFVGADGQLQFIGSDGKLYNFNFDTNTGKYTGIQQQTANKFVSLNNRQAAPFLSTINPNQLPAGAFAVVPSSQLHVSPGETATQILQGGLPKPRPLPTISPQPKTVNPQRTAPTRALQSTISATQLGSLPRGTTLRVAAPPPVQHITVAKPRPQPKLILGKPNNPTLVL